MSALIDEVIECSSITNLRTDKLGSRCRSSKELWCPDVARFNPRVCVDVIARPLHVERIIDAVVYEVLQLIYFVVKIRSRCIGIGRYL